MRYKSNKSQQAKFIVFVVEQIGVSAENLIMAELRRTFYSRRCKKATQHKRPLITGAESLGPIATEVVKYLEYRGMILASPLNTGYRQIRPLCKTPQFPKTPTGIVRLAEITRENVVAKLSYLNQGKAAFPARPKYVRRATPFPF